MGFGVWGIGLMVEGLGFRVSGLGFRVLGLGLRVEGLRFGVLGVWFGGLEFGVRSPQKTLCGGIPCSFLEPFARSWSHFVGIHRQKSTRSLEN